MDFSLLNLPAQIQIAAASGYAAYLAANTGIRGHHTATETAFGSAAYGLVATAVLSWKPLGDSLIGTGILAFALTVFAGLFWRKIGCRLWLKTLAYLEVSRSDDSPSAWLSIQDNTKNYLTQISVELDDGSWLSCDDTALFRDAPFGPCVLGPNGDVAFYLTHQKRGGHDETRQVKTVRSDDAAYRLTYIPANRIRRVNLRHRSKT